MFPDKGPAIGPLWYVRSLLMFVVVSPLLVWLVRRSAWVCLVAMAAVLASWTPNAFSYGSLFKFYFNGLGLVCFAGGILLRMRGDRVLTILQSKMIGIIAICVGWVILAFVHRQELYAVRMIGYFATMIGLFALTPAGRWPKLLTANSFPIYVFHAVILHFLTLALRWVGWGRWPENVFANIVCFVFVVASCCLLAAGIRAIPRLRGLLLGGR